MSIPEFIHVLETFPDVSEQEADSVISLKEDYPFSQVLHAVSARISKDKGFNNASKELQLAAVYAADRAVLKSLMETFALKESELRSEVALLAKPLATGQIDYAKEVIQDMERLNQLKNNFELLFVDGTATSFVSTGNTILNQTTPEPIVDVKEGVVEEQKPEGNSSKSRKERIIELAKSVAVEPVTLEPRSTRKKRKDSAEVLIDQIVVTKEELSPESEKQKEQIQIIDHFIKAQPSILGTKEKNSASEDLSSIKTGDFNDNIISETLVEILVKQGKKEKAIEVLKKLIWKFPQKKAYFASQIEELKK